MKSNKVEFLGQSIGIDVSMDKVDCCFAYKRPDNSMVIKGTKCFNNNLEGFKLLLKWTEKWLIKDKPLNFVMEATGVYYENLAYFFAEKTDYKVVVLLPNKSKAFAKSLNIKTKTDKADAKVLALMGLERCLDAWKAPDKEMQLIKSFSREKEDLILTKTMVSNQLHALKHAHVSDTKTIKRTEGLIQHIDKLVREVDKSIDDVLKKNPLLSLKIDKLCTIPGVGRITAITVLAETNAFALFKSRSQLVSYAGLDVIENQSGTSRGKTRISKKGNSRLRKIMHYAALTHINCNSIYKPLHQRVLDASGVKMKAYVAVQRKILTLMFTLFKKDEVFDTNYSSLSKKEVVLV